jgi:hypothetical protein
MSDDPCEKCGEGDRVKKERFCTACKNAWKLKASQEGYLFKLPPKRRYRKPEQREAACIEPNPWGENAVRALEDRYE